MSGAAPKYLRRYLEMVKFSHSLFAMPFALAATVWAAGGWPRPRSLLLIVLAMVTCRNAAMAWNRLVDARIDALNPRTTRRHLPAGLLGRGQVLAFLGANAALFVLVTYFINPLAFALSVPTLLVVGFYSWTKRFTSLSHFFLGLATGISPVGAWVAVRGRIDAPALALACALGLWMAGFDIIYATQDQDFDRRQGLHSMVVRLGLRGALRLSLGLHAAMLALLLGMGAAFGLGPAYLAAVALAGAFLAYLHFFRKSASLEDLNQDFLVANIAVGFCVLVGVVAAVWTGAAAPR